jgi:hypothetical protein
MREWTAVSASAVAEFGGVGGVANQDRENNLTTAPTLHCLTFDLVNSTFDSS